MAIFTAIATAIVTYATGAAVVAGTWAAFAVSVIATGLAAATARLIGGPGARGGSGTQDQGVRIQLPPATENKIPIIYGRAFQQPIITDARISSSGGTTQDIMTYVLTLSEYTQTGSFTCNDVYWNDQKLVFDTDGLTVISSITSDGEPSTNLANLVKVYMFAGGSGSSFNIPISGGATPGVNAYDIIPEVTSDYLMSDLVFAVVQLTYSSEKGVTSLPTMTFDITNSLSNPGDVWLDYMTSTRYGAGLQLGDLNEDSAVGAEPTSLKNVSDEIPPNQFNNDSTTSTQARYVINGVLNTGDTVKNNIERINMASSSWTTFDHKLGRWTIVVNRAATNTEILDAKHYNDDNIIGEISLTSTNLEDLYNGIEVAFANRNARDQSDYYKSTIDPSLRNDLEPDNTLRMRLDLCNNKIHAGRVGQIELRQSRYDLLITFTADYTALETEVGDIIKVSNPIYDFDEKLFRVTRVRETEGEDGALAAEITALQYDSSVYTDTTLEDAADKPNTNIPPIGSNQYIPPPGIVTVINSQPNVNSPNFTLQTTLATTSTLLTVVEWYYSTNGTNYNYLTNERAAGGFSAGSTVTDIIYTLGQGSYYFRARVGSGAIFSDLGNTSTQFIWNPVGTINSQTVITTGSFTWALLGDKTGALGPTAIGLGQNAGGTQTNTIAIGAQAGQTVQRENSIAIGYQAGKTNQEIAAIAVGLGAGQTNQNENAVAIGTYAGQSNQGSSIAIGNQAGENSQGNYSIAIGSVSGFSTQSNYATAVGFGAAEVGQNEKSIALGYRAARYWQNTNSIAIGNAAAYERQGSRSVAIGDGAGYADQGPYSIAIGYNAATDSQTTGSIVLSAGVNSLQTATNAGFYVNPIRNTASNQVLYYNTLTKEITYDAPTGGTGTVTWATLGDKTGAGGPTAIGLGKNAGGTATNTIAIGETAGQSGQREYSIALGYEAGQTNQGTPEAAQTGTSIAIGYRAGKTNQKIAAVALGTQAGETNQDYYSVAIGYTAGATNFPNNSVAIGTAAGAIDVGEKSVNIGTQAGYNRSGAYTVNLGYFAGTKIGVNSISIGKEAASLCTASNSIFIGLESGYYNTATDVINLGYRTGYRNQRSFSSAIGYEAGQDQGAYSLALGYQAGKITQTTGSIILSAGSNSLMTATNAGFYVNPIRNTATNEVVYYNTATKEVSYGPPPGGITQAQAEDIAIIYAIALG